MSVTLFLLNQKGFQCLQNALKEKKLKQTISLVVVGKDPGNQDDHYEEITQLCIENGIKVVDRKNATDISSRYSIAIGWKWLIFGIKNLIVVHDSLLPKYRGFSPLPNMLINGEKLIGATAIFASDSMDEGDIISQESLSVNYPIKIKEAIDLISDVYVQLTEEILRIIAEDKILPQYVQDSSQASFSIWRDSDDYFIDWSKDASYIKRFVDAVGYPYDGAKTRLNNDLVIRIKDVEVVAPLKCEIKHFGKILMYVDKYPVITSGENAIKIMKAEYLDGTPFSFNKLRVRLK